MMVALCVCVSRGFKIDQVQMKTEGVYDSTGCLG